MALHKTSGWHLEEYVHVLYSLWSQAKAAEHWWGLFSQSRIALASCCGLLSSPFSSAGAHLRLHCLFCKKKKWLAYCTALPLDLNLNMKDGSAKRTRGKQFTGALTFVRPRHECITGQFSASSLMDRFSVRSNQPCALLSLGCTPAQRLFLHHIISVIIYHSKLICSQPSLCWAICMTNWMPSMLISRYFTPRLD